MKRSIFFLVILILGGAQELCGQIAAGPMIGYVDLREVLIWVQTYDRAELVLEYRPVDSERVYYSQPVLTESANAFAAKLIADRVEPGQTYTYDLIVNGFHMNLEDHRFSTQTLWQYRSEPPAFSMLTGSCAFINEPAFDRPGKAYGGEYRIFESMAKEEADLMLWLGDNTYLREADWSTRTGVFHRYSHTRRTPELQDFLRSCAHYAIWDDHDYGPNDSDRSFIHKKLTRDAFEAFWGNPAYGLTEGEGITTQFSYHGVDFFLLDNRWFRSNYKLKGVQQLLGQAQIDWLIEALKYSKAQFKMVAIGGQVLSDAALYENYAQYPEEQAYLLKRLDEEQIEGVIFLSGDRHHTELSKLTLPGGCVVHDLTVSPLTSTSYDHREEANHHRVEGSIFGERNYARLHFDGTRKNRRLEIDILNADGQSLWSYVIQREDLKALLPASGDQ